MTPKPQSAAQRLLKIIDTEGPKLRAISEARASERPSGGAGWSRKQELGHLLDSAVNNRVRFVVGALQGAYTGPKYDGEGWVALGGYAEAAWSELVDLWIGMSRAIARVIERVPAERLGSECRVGDFTPMTLEFLIDDYMDHMQHHLGHLLG